MTTKQLTPEEIQKLKNIQTSQNELIEKFGVIEYQIAVLEKQKQKLKEDLATYIQKEENLGAELQTKYGSGTIILEKGEFISS
jgi:hypothetical protein